MENYRELEKLKILLNEEYCETDTIANQNKILGKLELLEEIIPMVRSIEIDNDILLNCKNKMRQVLDGQKD